MLSLAAAFIGELVFDSARLNLALQSGDVGATLAMEQMVLNGTPLRDAHHAVAARVQDGALAIDARTVIEAYRTVGSANPAETRRVAQALISKLADPTTPD
jgi:argininosuccinate lyase